MLIGLLFLCGCANMSPEQKTAAWIAGGIVVTSIAISASGDNYVAPCPTNHWEFRTNGMGWICVAP